MLNVGVIGLGRLGKKHALTIGGAVANARLTAVCDPVASLMDDVRGQFPGAKAFKSPQEMINSSDVDAVVIASATNTHTELLREVIAAGKPVFCEKPLSLDVSEAKEICRLTEERNSFVQIGFMRRFDNGYAKARQAVENGEIGDVISIHCISRDPGAPPVEFVKTSGGLFFDLAVHDIDLIRWFLDDPVKTVRASAACLKYTELAEAGDVDHGNIHFTTRKGLQADAEASRNAEYGYDVRTEIIGTRGAVFVGNNSCMNVSFMTKGKASVQTVPGFLERFEQAYETELGVFVNDVLKGKKPSVTAYDGMMAVLLAGEAKRSFYDKKEVEIKED